MLTVGDQVPWFSAPTNVNEEFHFDRYSGHRLVVVFLGSLGLTLAASLWQELSFVRRRLAKRRIQVVGITQDAQDRTRYALMSPDGTPTMFWDQGLRAANAFDMLKPHPNKPGQHVLQPCVYLLDRSLIVAEILPLNALGWSAAALLIRVDALWPPDLPDSGVGHAPVLMIPRVVDPAMCRRLIELWTTNNGDSGFMRSNKDGKQYGLLDDTMKRRRDHFVARDNPIRNELRSLIRRRILTPMLRAFHYRITRIERYCIACYDGANRGFFGAHRDYDDANSHRAFAMTLNLNAEEYEGGDLRFPEFGQRLYRPETGTAIIFSGYLLHEATPVTSGRRFALLSFFYGEREQRARSEYFRRHGDTYETIDLRDKQAVVGGDVKEP